MTFKLVDGADVDAFLAADARLQTDFAYQQPGLMRRTTGRGDEGWIVIDVWDTADQAEACAARWETNPVAQEFMRFVDKGSVEVRRYTDLGG